MCDVMKARILIIIINRYTKLKFCGVMYTPSNQRIDERNLK